MPKYPYLRLEIPSLSQWNAGQPDESQKWCGRTAGSMIYNYYVATRDPGGVEAAFDLLITNKQDAAPHDLVFRGGPLANQIAVPGYNLLDPVQRVKKDGWVREKLFPLTDPARKAILDGKRLLEEHEIIAKLEPILRGLDALNPALIWTGLSSSDGTTREVRHLVVVSGYRVDADGTLWLHIDDPSSTAYQGGKLQPVRLEAIINGTKPTGIPDAVMQVVPDTKADDRPGQRYWLRAAVLFRPNLHSLSATDFWCDHQDSPGFEVAFNHDAEKERGSLVDLPGDPRYPVSIQDHQATLLWTAAARAGDPYPLSARRSWHNGIHIPKISSDTQVYAIAPGRVVIAWFPERVPGQPDRGMVVMRHALDLKTLSFVDARENEPPEGAVWVHSLYANLAGGAVGADALLQRIRPQPKTKPPLTRYADVGTAVLLLTQGGATLAPAQHEGLAKRKNESELFEVADTSWFAIARESRTVGVELTGRPWVLDGDVVKVKAGFTGKTGRLFRALAGSGAGRYFPEAKRGRDYVDVTVDADTTLSPLEVFTSRGIHRALVEVREVVATKDNAEQIAEWEHLDAACQEVRDRVCGSQYADLEGVDPRCRDFIDAAIGFMGVQRGDAELGVHVELFANDNLTAGAHAGGRWSLLEEVSGTDNGTAEFFAKQLEALLSATRSRHGSGGAHTSDPSLQGPAGNSQPTSLISHADDGSPITVAEWVDYCAVEEHARELSQVVAKHRSEWTLDLVEDASNRIALRGVPEALRKAVFPASLDLPGLDTDTYHYFHPLRLIEWLRTGIDVRLHDLPTDKRDGVSLVLALGDAEFELVRQAPEDNYRLRLVLGDGDHAHADDPNALVSVPDWISRGVLRLGGIDTQHTEIEVELQRNKVTGLTLTQPGGDAHTVRSIGARKFGLPFGGRDILVAKDEEKIVHLLADRGGPLDDLECSAAKLVVEARYNVEPPDRMVLALPEGFVVQSLVVSGAIVETPAGGWGSGQSVDVPLGKPPRDHGVDELVTAARTVLVTATLVPAARARASGSASIELSGGDLVEPVKGEWKLEQRDIKARARGQDVAKVQVYLSQILCGSFACLRGAQGPTGNVDGDYFTATGLALWRFLLHYRPALASVTTASGSVSLDRVPLTEVEVETQAAALQKQHGGPTVTQPLLDAIVSFYRLPYIGVSCTIAVDTPRLTLSIPALAKKWPAWNSKQRTRIVPLADVVQLHLSIAVACVVPGDLASVGVSVELVDGDAYRLLTPPTMALNELVAHGVTLVPSGQLDAAKAKPKLVLTADSGGQLAAIDLGGATDVRASGTEVGLDAAILQTWLGLQRNGKGAAYFAAAVDGSFGNGSKSALDAFCADNYAKTDKPTYPEILERLRSGEQSFVQEAAQ